ncbi:hypothetical protein FRB90_011886, partial [Tulasnella sp. 427]
MKRDQKSASVSQSTRRLPKKVKLLLKTSADPSHDRGHHHSKGGKTIPLSYFFSAKRLPKVDHDHPSTHARQHSTGFSIEDLQEESPASFPAGISFIGEDDNLLADQYIDEEGDQSVPSEDPLALDPSTYIPFGELRSTTNPKICYALEMLNDSTGTHKITVGWHKDCRFRVFGPGVGQFHCSIFLNLGVDKNGHLVREVVVHKMESLISPPTLTTTICAKGEASVVQSTWVLKSGQTVQFGQSDEYLYVGPKFVDLYSPTDEAPLYEGIDYNSRVLRVQGRYDGLTFVVKIIPCKHKGMAKTEIEMFRRLGHHQRIVQYVEAFYDSETDEHHLIFESGSENLKSFMERNRVYHNTLRQNYARWIKQIVEGLLHLHNLGIAHRDLKPENILICISETGRVEVKIMDMGVARHSTGPITKRWFAGTNKWAAPGPFMVYRDDKIVDCYG